MSHSEVKTAAAYAGVVSAGAAGGAVHALSARTGIGGFFAMIAWLVIALLTSISSLETWASSGHQIEGYVNWCIVGVCLMSWACALTSLVHYTGKLFGWIGKVFGLGVHA